MLCCEDQTAFVFKITNQMTNEVKWFTPPDITGDPARWNTFEIVLVEESGDEILEDGILNITTASTWDYEIWSTIASPIDLNDLDLIEKVETGILKVHNDTQYPSADTGSLYTPAFN